MKPNNIMVDFAWNCRIADLGTMTSTSTILAGNANNMALTYAWASPEVVKGVRAMPGDVFAFGLMMYEILANHIPCRYINNIDLVLKWQPMSLEVLDSIDTDTMELINRCIVLDPSERCTMEEVMEQLNPFSIPKKLTQNDKVASEDVVLFGFGDDDFKKSVMPSDIPLVKNKETKSNVIAPILTPKQEDSTVSAKKEEVVISIPPLSPSFVSPVKQKPEEKKPSMENSQSVSSKLSPRNINLISAIEKDQVEAIKKMIKQKVDLNVKDENEIPAIGVAINKNNERIVKLLIQAGVNCNIEDGNGDFPIGYIIEKKNTPMLKLLLSSKTIDVNSQDRKGRTPLILCVISKFMEGIELLKKSRAMVNEQDENGHLAIMFAILEKDEKALDLLLQFKDLNLELRDIKGRTPLILSAEQVWEYGVKLLAEKGADSEAIDMEGYSAPAYVRSTLGEEKERILFYLPKFIYWEVREIIVLYFSNFYILVNFILFNIKY
jgi:ankyrin repeat protein